MLDAARADILAFAAFPKAHRPEIWSAGPPERLNREIRRRTVVAGIFPNRQAIVRLAGAALAERDEERQVARRHMGLETLAKARINVIEGDVSFADEEVRKLVT